MDSAEKKVQCESAQTGKCEREEKSWELLELTERVGLEIARSPSAQEDKPKRTKTGHVGRAGAPSQ